MWSICKLLLVLLHLDDDGCLSSVWYRSATQLIPYSFIRGPFLLEAISSNLPVSIYFFHCMSDYTLVNLEIQNHFLLNHDWLPFKKQFYRTSSACTISNLPIMCSHFGYCLASSNKSKKEFAKLYIRKILEKQKHIEYENVTERGILPYHIKSSTPLNGISWTQLVNLIRPTRDSPMFKVFVMLWITYPTHYSFITFRLHFKQFASQNRTRNMVPKGSNWKIISKSNENRPIKEYCALLPFLTDK